MAKTGHFPVLGILSVIKMLRQRRQTAVFAKVELGDSMRAKRDYAMLAMLFGCGFRRSELVGLEMDEIQMRQRHWAVVDLIGKGSWHNGQPRLAPVREE